MARPGAKHLTRSQVKDLLQDALHPAERMDVAAHLLAGCPRCRDLAVDLRPDPAIAASGDPIGERIERIFDRAEDLRLAESIRRAEALVETLADLEWDHERGVALVRLAEILARLEPQRGAAVAREALKALNDEDRKVFGRAVLALIRCLEASGDPGGALQTYKAHAATLERIPDRRFRLEVAWLSGKIALGLGFYEEAGEVFGALARDFQEEDLVRELALLSLDQVRLDLATGGPGAALQRARTAEQRLRFSRPAPWLLKAWGELVRALRRQEADPAALRGLERALSRGALSRALRAPRRG